MVKLTTPRIQRSANWGAKTGDAKSAPWVLIYHHTMFFNPYHHTMFSNPYHHMFFNPYHHTMFFNPYHHTMFFISYHNHTMFFNPYNNTMFCYPKMPFNKHLINLVVTEKYQTSVQHRTQGLISAWPRSFMYDGPRPLDLGQYCQDLGLIFPRNDRAVG